ncbi:hypothetical protein P836_00284, partial [Klebsiella pneumoniae UCI 33]
SAIAAELEGFYLRQHGEEKGRLIACALLEDLIPLINDGMASCSSPALYGVPGV